MTLGRALALLVTVGAAGLGALPPPPAAAQGDSSAVAVNTRDGSSIFRLAFNIRRVTGDVVDQTNAAIAFSSCQECRAIAISIQVLLVSGSPSVVSPTNLAFAVNDRCTLCDSLALAYQFAVGGGERLRLTALGRQQVAEIRRELRELRGQEGLSDAELDARVGELMDRLAGVLDTELAPAGQGRAPEEQAAGPALPDDGPTTRPPPAPGSPAETTPADTTSGQTEPADTPSSTTPEPTPSTAPGQSAPAPPPTETSTAP